MVKMNATAPERLREHRERSALPLSLNNARQLGGIVLRDGRRVRDGLLLRTSRLADASEEDLRVLRERYRLSLILDMRGESEIRRAPDPDVPGAKWVQTDIIDFAFLLCLTQDGAVFPRIDLVLEGGEFPIDIGQR